MAHIVDVPKTCRACVCIKRGPDFQVELREDYPVPEPKDDEILIRLTCTGLCSSDIHNMIGDLGLGPSSDCPGHEGAGRVVKLGSRVTNWAIGDRVGVKPCMYACGFCNFCTDGLELNCPKKIMTAWLRNGTYCQYLTHPAVYASRIPDSISDEKVAPILCAGATVYRAIKLSGAKVGDWLAIPGAGGGVGSLAAQYAIAQGIRVVAIDTGAEKKQHCLDNLKCDAFIDFREISSVPEQVKHLTEIGAHALIVTGGSKEAYANWTDILRIGGTLIIVGLPPKGMMEVGADPITYVAKSLTVKGSMVASLRETSDAIAIAAAGKVKPVVTVHPFRDWLKVLDKLHQGKVTGRAVIMFDD